MPAGHAEVGLLTVVVELGYELALPDLDREQVTTASSRAVDDPTGKCPRGLNNVLFRVVAATDSEEFHDFAAVVFVDRAGAVLDSVEEHQHCRVDGDCVE